MVDPVIYLGMVVVRGDRNYCPLIFYNGPKGKHHPWDPFSYLV